MQLHQRKRVIQIMSKSIVLVISFSILLILSGCWNAKELTDVTIISGMGVDKTDKGELIVSVQAVNPDQVTTGKSGAGRNAAPTVVYSSTGTTIFAAFRNILQKLPNEAFVPHMNLIIINEEIAKTDGLNQILDIIERDYEPRSNAKILISRDIAAEKVLMMQSPLEKISATKITTQVETLEKRWGEIIEVDVDDVIRDLTSNGKELIISGITILGDEESGIKEESMQQSDPKAILYLGGLALFKNGKLTRWVEGETAKGISWILGRIEGTIDNVACDDLKEGIAIQTIKTNADIKSTIKHGEPAIQVSIQQEGNIGEVTCAKDLTKPETTHEIEKLLEEKIRNDVEMAINIAQEEKTDIFGFGSTLQRQHPQFWKDNEADWPEMFASLDVDVQIDANILRTGMRINSFHK